MGKRRWTEWLKFQFYRRCYRLLPAAALPRHDQPAIINYHHVAPASESKHPLVRQLGLTSTPQDFELQLQYLTQQRKCLTLDELLQTRDPRGVALTFDDGFRSVLTNVLPIVEKYKVPIKLYLVSQNLSGLNWENQLAALFDKLTPDEQTQLAKEALDPQHPQQGVPNWYDFLAHFDLERTPSVVASWFKKHIPGPHPQLYLNEAEAKKLLAHPLVSIGSHTRRHYPAPRLNAATVKSEIVAHHYEMQSRLGLRVQGFALPFGFRDYFTPTVCAAIRQVDQFAFSAYNGAFAGDDFTGLPEIRRLDGNGSVGTLWQRMRDAEVQGRAQRARAAP